MAVPSNPLASAILAGKGVVYLSYEQRSEYFQLELSGECLKWSFLLLIALRILFSWCHVFEFVNFILWYVTEFTTFSSTGPIGTNIVAISPRATLELNPGLIISKQMFESKDHPHQVVLNTTEEILKNITKKEYLWGSEIVSYINYFLDYLLLFRAIQREVSWQLTIYNHRVELKCLKYSLAILSCNCLTSSLNVII